MVNNLKKLQEVEKKMMERLEERREWLRKGMEKIGERVGACREKIGEF